MGKLLFTKKVDKSLLKAGLTVPSAQCKAVMNALGVSLKRGEKTAATIMLDGTIYHATLTFVDMKKTNRDVYQIRYSESSPICTELKRIFISPEIATSKDSSVEVWSSDVGLEFKCSATDSISIKDEFFKYLGDADSLYGYQKSYKLVFYRSYFSEAMYEDEIRADQLAKQFRQYYIDRKRAGLITEYEGADDFVISPEKGSVEDYYSLIIRNPFNAISKKGYFTRDSLNGKQYFAIQPELYEALNEDDLERIRDLIQKKLELYYSKVSEILPKKKIVSAKKQKEDGTAEDNKLQSSGQKTVESKLKGSYTLRDALYKFMDEYAEQKKLPMGGNALAEFIRKTLPQTILETGIVSSEKYKVVASAGAGNWATIPWLSIFDKSVTQSAVEGVYIVYLLSKDTNRLYLTLNQGCTNLRKTHSKKDTIKLMHEEAEAIRRRIAADGFTPDDDINLGENLNELGELYQRGSIFYREYTRDKLPSELELRADLQSMIDIYSQYANPSQQKPEGTAFTETSATEKAWLLTWNPQNWNWDNYAAGLEASRFDEKFEVTWSTANTHVAPGDRMYLMILGNNGVRGIIASGTAISKVFEVPHWDYKKAAKGQKTNSVKVSFDKILDFRTDQVLKIETLQEIFPEQKWNPQSSGIEIKDKYTGALKNLWDQLISKQSSGAVNELLDLLNRYASERQ